MSASQDENIDAAMAELEALQAIEGMVEDLCPDTEIPGEVLYAADDMEKEAQEQAEAPAAADAPAAEKQASPNEDTPQAPVPAHEAPSADEPAEEAAEEDAVVSAPKPKLKKPNFSLPKPAATAKPSSTTSSGSLPTKKAKFALPLVVAKDTAADPTTEIAGKATPTPSKKTPAKLKAPTAAVRTPAAPKKPTVAAKKPAKAAADAEEDAAEDEAGKLAIKRPKSTFMFYSAGTRATIKAENPELTFGAIAKAISANWAALSEAEKAPWQAQADADKARYQAEVAAAGGEEMVKAARKQSKDKKGEKAEKGEKSATVKSAFQLFSDEKRPKLKKKDPKAGAKELNKLLSEAWKEAPDSEKEFFIAMNKQLKEEAAAAAAQLGDDEDASGPSAAAAKKKKRARPVTAAPAAAKPHAGGFKRPKTDEDDAEQKKEGPAEGSDSEDPVQVEEMDEDAIDRINVDWVAHPAEAIISRTDSTYVVARKGMPLHQYGEVSIAAANAQRMGCSGTFTSAAAADCPLSVQHLDDYDAFLKGFKLDVFNNQDGRELDLEHLREGSLLEACAFLGEMRAKGGELAAPNRKEEDMWMRVPTMATCRVVQRMLQLERKRADEWKAKAQRLMAKYEPSAAAAGKAMEVEDENATMAET